MLPPVNPDDGGYGYDDRQGRRGRQKKSNTSTILLVVAGILVLIGAILIGRVIFSENEGANQVKAPNLVGSTLEEAQTLASRTGVTVQKGADEPCEQQEKGQICSQDPKADAMMDKDGTVTVVVSSGAPQIEVPNVLEKSEDGAREELEGKGFSVNVTTEESEAAEGTVIKQNPKGGQKADEESEVTITIAKQTTDPMPDVRTRQYDAAVAQLNQLGFTNVSRTDVDSDKPAGEVIEQTPAGPSNQAKDVQIVLKVSKGPEQPEQVPVPDLQNKTLGEAKTLLAQAGLQLGSVQGSNDDNARVVNFQPQANQMVDKNTAVTVQTLPGGGGGDGNLFGGLSGERR